MMVVPEGGSLFEHNMTDGRGRPHRRRALDPGGAASTTTCTQLWTETQGRLHADAHRRLRRHLGRELLVRRRRTCGRTSACSRSCRARVIDARSRRPRRWRRTRSATTSTTPRIAEELLNDAGVARPARRPRPARGARRALGDLDVRAGRHDAAAGASAPPRSAARTTSAWTRTSARSRPGKLADLRRARRQPARRHPQLGSDPLRDRQRPRLRRPDPRSARAQPAQARALLLAEGPRRPSPSARAGPPSTWTTERRPPRPAGRACSPTPSPR